MSFDYDELADTALEVLTEFGASFTLRNSVVPTYTPATGTAAAAAPTDVARKGVLMDFGAGVTNGPGGLIEVGDKRLLLEVGTVPGLEDQIITAAGVIYRIKGVGEVNPAGTPIVYDLHLRK